MSDDLQIVIDKNADENVKNIHAAVSPDCSYRLVRDAVNAAQSTLDLYIWYCNDNSGAARNRQILHRSIFRNHRCRNNRGYDLICCPGGHDKARHGRPSTHVPRLRLKFPELLQFHRLSSRQKISTLQCGFCVHQKLSIQ